MASTVLSSSWRVCRLSVNVGVRSVCCRCRLVYSSSSGARRYQNVHFRLPHLDRKLKRPSVWSRECTSAREISSTAPCHREEEKKGDESSRWSIGALDDSTSFEKENIWTVPNVLSFSRILLAPVLGYLVLHEQYLMGFGLLAVTAVSDVVDGQIARKYPGQSSLLGSVLDPLADKCLVSILCVSLTVQGLIPLPLTVLILARDAFLIGASFYLRYTTLPPPRTWSRYWDIQRSTLQVTPTTLSKVNTLLQLLTVGLSLGAPLVDATHHPALQLLWLSTAVTTVASGASYIIRMKGFRILRKKRARSHS